MKKLHMLYALAVLSLISFSNAGATTVLPMDLGKLTANAEMIFIGTVVDVRSQKESNALYTYVTFGDLEIVKGTYTAATIEARLLGGSVGGETLEVVGMPKFVLGERNMIFLAGNFRYSCPIVGWGQGRFKIAWDELSRQEVILDNESIPISGVKDKEVVRAKRGRAVTGFPGIPDSRVADVLSEPQQREIQTFPVQDFVSVIQTIMGIKP